MKKMKKAFAGLMALSMAVSALPSQAVVSAVDASAYDVQSASARKISAVTGDMLSVDFADGTAKDKSQTNNSFTQIGTPSVSMDSDIGKNAVTLNGESAYAYSFNDSKYNKMISSVSVECTFKLDEIPESGEFDIFSNQQSGGIGIGLENGKLNFYCNVDGSYYQPKTTIETNKWYHAVGTYDGHTAKLFVNGVLVDSIEIDGNVKFTTNETAKNFIIGGDSSSDNGVEFLIKGKVAAANLYSTVLSDEQINANYNSALVAEEVEVPAADMLDVDFSSGSANDNSPTNNTLTTVGSPVVEDDTGLNSKAATFNGSYDAYRYAFDATKYSKMTNAATCQATFRYNEIPESGEYDVLSNQQAGGMGLGIENGVLQFFCNVNGTYYQPNYKIEAGKWYNCAGVYDGTNVMLYVNGKLVDTVYAPGSIHWPDSETARNFVIGGDSSTDNEVQFLSETSVARAKVYSQALTAAQIEKEYKSMTPVIISIDEIYSSIEINSKVTVPNGVASNGNEVTVKVTDPDGQEVTVTENKFTAAKAGKYTFEYSVEGSDGLTYKNTVTKNCIDPANLHVNAGIVSTSTMYAGNLYTANVHVNVDEDVTANGIELDVKYDPEVMSFVSYENNNLSSSVKDDKNGTVHISLSDHTLSSESYAIYSQTLLSKLTFRISETAESGTTQLGFENVKLYNDGIVSNTTPNAENKTITITEKNKSDLNGDGVIGAGDIALANSAEQAEEIASQAKIYPYKHAVVITIDGGGICFDGDEMYYVQDGETILTSDEEIMSIRKNRYALNLLNNKMATSFSASSETPTISAQNYSSILHGVEYATVDSEYKVDNSTVGYEYYPDFSKVQAKYPSVFKTINAQNPQRANAAFSEWSQILNGIIEPDSGVYNWSTQGVSGQSKAFSDVADYITTDNFKNTAMVYIQSDLMDATGHGSGFYNDNYYRVLQQYDDYLRTIVNSLKEANSYDDTLLVINADHGGTAGGSHGGTTDQEYDIQIALGGQTIDSGKKLSGGTNHDISPIVLSALRLETPETMNGNDTLLDDAALNQYELSAKDRNTETVTAVRGLNSINLKLSDVQRGDEIGSIDMVINLATEETPEINTEGTILRQKVENGKLYLSIKYDETPESLATLSFDSLSDDTVVDEYMLGTTDGREIYGDLKEEKALQNDISNAEFNVIADQTYLDGMEITPLTTLRLDGKLLLKGRDYTVSYANNKEIGTATVTVTGKGKYSGKYEKTFEIKARTDNSLNPLMIIGKQTTPYAAVVSWVPVFKTNGTEISYSYNEDMTNAEIASVEGYGVNTCAINSLRGDKENGYDNSKKLYVRIRSYIYVDGEKTYSEWSEVRTINPLN